MKLNTARQSNGELSTHAELPAHVRTALAVLRAYKMFVSPYFRGSCRFLPSCADYMTEAIVRHGLCVGCWLGLRRLLRCHPFGRAGYDPVPLRTER